MDKKAAIWARISGPTQNEMSLEDQVERVTEKLEAQAYRIGNEHIIETTWTSTDLKSCPEFQKLNGLIRRNEIQAIGMLDRDRMEDNGLQRLIFFAECENNGVEIILYQGAPFISGEEGWLDELVEARGKRKANVRAQTGAKQGLERRAKGTSRKLNFQQLPPSTQQVYGMKWQDGSYQPDENYPNACLIFKLWFERHNKGYIATELSRRGIPTPRGRRVWQGTTLNTLLQNPVYAGRVATLKYEKVEPKKRGKPTTFGKSSIRKRPENEWHWLAGDPVGEHPISREQHLDIKRTLEENKAKAKRNNKHDDLGRCIIKCQFCGRICHVGRNSWDGRRYYYCPGSRLPYPDKCEAKRIYHDEFEDALKAKLREFLENPAVYLEEAQARLKSGETKEEVEGRIQDLEKKKQKTIDDERKLARKLSDEAFELEKPLILAQRTWCKEQIEREKAQLANLEACTVQQETVESMKERLQHNLDNATFEDWCSIRDALGTEVLNWGDGTWEVRVSVPTEVIVNETPRCKSGNDRSEGYGEREGTVLRAARSHLLPCER